MNTPRVDQFAFNPEKFLADDLKKAKECPFSNDWYPPVRFSNKVKTIFFDRLRRESPIALCESLNPEELKLGLNALKAQLREEIKGMRLPADDDLFRYLFCDVMNELTLLRSRKKLPEG